MRVVSSTTTLLRLLHIALAACVLAATTGWVSSEHSCGGEVVSRGHFAAAQPCSHAAPAAPVCLHHPAPAVGTVDGEAEDGCCDDRVTLDKSDDLLDYAPDGALPTAPPVRASPPRLPPCAAPEPTPVVAWVAHRYRPPPLGSATIRRRLARLGEWRC